MLNIIRKYEQSKDYHEQRIYRWAILAHYGWGLKSKQYINPDGTPNRYALEVYPLMKADMDKAKEKVCELLRSLSPISAPQS